MSGYETQLSLIFPNQKLDGKNKVIVITNEGTSVSAASIGALKADDLAKAVKVMVSSPEDVKAFMAKKVDAKKHSDASEEILKQLEQLGQRRCQEV